MPPDEEITHHISYNILIIGRSGEHRNKEDERLEQILSELPAKILRDYNHQVQYFPNIQQVCPLVYEQADGVFIHPSHQDTPRLNHFWRRYPPVALMIYAGNSIEAESKVKVLFRNEPSLYILYRCETIDQFVEAVEKAIKEVKSENNSKKPETKIL